MNERIKELALQAGFDVKRLLEPYPGGFPREDMLALESFVELIVRECADISVNSQYVNNKSEYYEGFNEALIYAGNKIKKHFGVEE